MSHSTAPNLSARVFYGLRTDIQYNAHYLSESEILYPAGSVLVIHNHLQKKQKFIRLPEKNKPIKSMVLAPNRRWLALNEMAEADGQNPTITVYDLSTYKRRKVLTVPFENSTAKEFACLAFTHDSKYLIAVTGEPDWNLYAYNWDKGKVESHTKAQNPSGLGTVKHIHCNPADSTLIVLTGPNTFRIMCVVETVWRQWGWSKADNLNITTSVWLTAERIMFGTHNGLIMLVENGEIRQNCVYQAMDVLEMPLKKEETEQEEIDKISSSSKQDYRGDKADQETYPVTSFVSFQKGIAYCCGPGYVHMFEKETPHHFRKRNLFRISRQSYAHAREYPVWATLDAIQHLTVDPNQETLLITTLRKQLYYVKIFGLHMLQNPELPFIELGPGMHYGRISSLALCAWKPIFMTAGADDRSVRVWNYMTDDVEMIRIYQEDISCVSLHPTGIFALVGFQFKLRFVVILIDDFDVLREFSIRNCQEAKFSTNGHLFAAVNGQIIQVFSSISFSNLYNLKGHCGKITCLSWSSNDTSLLSCGADGAVYEWSMYTGKRSGEIVLKDSEFNGCATNRAGKTTYVVGMDGELKEIGSSTVRRSLPLLGCPLNNIVLSRSDLMLFISGGETIAAVQLPLLDKAIFNEFHMHNKQVRCIALSYDDQTLVSVAEDASICLWRLTNADGRAVAMDKDFAYAQEVLISKQDLENMMNDVNLLSTRMTELETEHAYRLRQSEATHAEKLKEVHEGYNAAIEELKEKNEQMESEHDQDVEKIQKEIIQLRSGHLKTLQALETDFNLRLVGEYDRYQTLEDKTNSLRVEFVQKLEDLAESKELALNEMTSMYEARIAEKDQQLKELAEQIEAQGKENEIIKAEIEEDGDREIIEIRTAYEMQLKFEKDTNVQLKGEMGLMKKKLINAYQEIEDFKHLVIKMKSEHVQFQQNIATLERDVQDLKTEVAERNMTIQEKEKRIYEMKQKKQELEKYKYVLNFKITELRNQIEPKQRVLKEIREQIEDMENEEYKLEQTKHALELQISQLNDKLVSTKKDFYAEREKFLMMKNVFKKIKVDLYEMTGTISDPPKMKLAVKDLFHKYSGELDMHARYAEDEAISEYNRQREHLEKQLATAKASLAKALTGSKGDFNKIMDENCILLNEVNNLRAELKTTRTRIAQMETILGVTKEFVPPQVARAKLKKVADERDQVDFTFKKNMEEQEAKISNLKQENERLLDKIRCSSDMIQNTEGEISTLEERIPTHKEFKPADTHPSKAAHFEIPQEAHEDKQSKQ